MKKVQLIKLVENEIYNVLKEDAKPQWFNISWKPEGSGLMGILTYVLKKK